MPTSTDVTNLKINQLTEAQYDTAVQGGMIGANEISILTDAEVGQTIQVDVLPTASADELGKIYQFVGTTDANYTNGFFYKCVSDGATPAVYSWEAVEVQASSGGLPSQTGQNGKFLTTDGTDASWSDKPLVNTNPSNSTSTIVIGNNGGTLSSVGNGAICLTHMGDYSGWISLGNGAIAIGNTKSCSGYKAINIGGASCSGNYAIQLGGSQTNPDANTFKVGNNNGNFEMMSADGTIPTDRFTTTPSTDGTYNATITVANGVVTRSWASGGSGGGVSDVTVNGTSVVSGGVAVITCATIDDTSTSSQTATWSASKLNTTIGNIESLLAAI